MFSSSFLEFLEANNGLFLIRWLTYHSLMDRDRTILAIAQKSKFKSVKIAYSLIFPSL